MTKYYEPDPGRHCIVQANFSIDNVCAGLLNRYWRGQELLASDRSRLNSRRCYLYIHHMHLNFFCGSFSPKCQEKYFKKIVETVSSRYAFGKKHQKWLRRALRSLNARTYFPLVLCFSSFLLNSPHIIIIDYQNTPLKNLPYLISYWHSENLISTYQHVRKPEESHFSVKTMMKRLYPIFRKITEEDIIEERKNLMHYAAFNQLDYYFDSVINDMLLSHLEKKEREYTPLVRVLLLGFVVKQLTKRKRKIFHKSEAQDFVNNLLRVTENEEIKKPLTDLLWAVCKTKFAKEHITKRKLQAKEKFGKKTLNHRGGFYVE